ncbi:transglycosylase SLT domain-containing protein [Nocardia veterana]|uniref:Transglycosylase SLT domain-containing protein n=2 Tax=Nocardia veterana TaxID=132249 RepID=A0A7X6LZY9_9NOCA|nr:transglycosylase SLT domain-containing protein [Nocardia veterana]NKY87662.1 transglycosylase SLT domain-containing protein [Nocardia veterana]
MSKTTTSSRAKAAARTAGSATLALAAFAAITSAGGHKSDDVKPVALASTIAAAAEKTQPTAAAEPIAAAAPAPAAPAAAAIPAPMPAPAPEPVLPPPPPPAPVYPDNLDGWIRNALDIMAAHGIPGSYDGIYRNIIRESSGNPQAINLYDINAMNGIPSKGLLQVIDPTFQAYHVDGTSWDIWDPVANIAAACNYAAHRYGSMDNVNSAY